MSTVVVRNPSPGEVERAAEIAAIAFPNLPLEHWQDSFYMTARLFGEQWILVAELEGRLVSSMICTPGPVYIGDGTVSHSAVGAVGTLPECRKQGCAGAMMAECVRLLHTEGVCTSSLWPFSYEYYRKFGWELGSETRTYTAASSVFAELGDANRVRRSKACDLEGIMLAYDRFARGYNCLTERNGEWWREVAWSRKWLKPASGSDWACVVHERNGSVDGYIIYSVRATSAGEQIVEVKETVFCEAEDRYALLAGLAAAVPYGVIAYGAPVDDTLIHELRNPRLMKCTVSPAYMFRVIDPPGAMLARRVEAHLRGKLSFAVSDPVFISGSEFGIEIVDGTISLCDFDPYSALTMDVQTLAKLYTGCLAPMQAWHLGGIKIRGDVTSTLALAQGVFSTLTPYRSWLEPG